MNRNSILLVVTLLACAAAACNGDRAQSIADGSTATTEPTQVIPTPTVVPTTTLLFTGDLIPARCTYAKVESLGGDYELPFRALHDYLVAPDITVGTLDATASDAGTPFGCTPTF